MFEANVMGTMRLTKELLPKLIASGNGHVVAVTSIAAFEVYRGGSGYSAAKVYEGVEPLSAADIAECIRWATSLPPHVNVDEIVVRPRAQASATEVHREG